MKRTIKYYLLCLTLLTTICCKAQFTKLLDFVDTINGGYPHGSLIQANDGMMYGMTDFDNAYYGYGTLFQFNPVTSAFIHKVAFDFFNGSSPMGSLLQASDGMIYGMTHTGGTYNGGVLFQFNPVTNTYIKKIDFDGLNGARPRGTLIQASDGMLYGLTSEGGINNAGVIFQYDPVNNICISKFDFSSSVSGSSPWGDLVQANNGILYGMTNMGGANDIGVLFQYDPASNIYTKLLDFSYTTKNGAKPTGNLIQASDGMLYGSTSEGGSNGGYYGHGVIFQYDPLNSTYTKKFDLGDNTTSIMGRMPISSLMQASDGMMYSMAWKGGINNIGVIYQYNPTTNVYTKLYDFTGSAWPYTIGATGNLIQANDGTLYGMTSSEGVTTPGCGSNGCGTLFKYDIITGISPYSYANTQIITYPNPTSSKLTIATELKISEINLIDVTGKTIKSIKQNTYTISVADLPAGIYFIKLITDEKTIIQKFVKQ